MMIMMGSPQPLELRKMAVEGLLYPQALPALKYIIIILIKILYTFSFVVSAAFNFNLFLLN